MDSMQSHAQRRWAFALALVLFTSAGCRATLPKPIELTQNNLPPELIDTDKPQIERGKKIVPLDAVGWVVGIPSKLVLWNRRVDNHNISETTEQYVQSYLDSAALPQVKVRLNQYAPLQDWARLRRNTSVAWPWRYTLGVGSLAYETLLPGRLIGGDHYNPYTATIHLYSDVPVIGMHEGAHAKDWSRRKYPGTYAFYYLLPTAPLFHESIASRDVLAYTQAVGDADLERQAYHVLTPAYGTYVGNAVGSFVPTYTNPVYFGSILAGHAIGRSMARFNTSSQPGPSAQLGSPNQIATTKQEPEYKVSQLPEQPSTPSNQF